MSTSGMIAEQSNMVRAVMGDHCLRRFIYLLAALLAAPLHAGQQPWILVDTAAATLTVMHGNKAIKRYKNISLGKGGVSRVRMRGDDTTPLGEFRITRVKNRSAYHRFYEFNFPTLDHADAGFQTGIIDLGTYLAIMRSIRGRILPPQNTALGGHLGIHGIGSGNRKVHDQFNWTNGCIALTNEQIDELNRWLRVGTKVVVR